MTEELEAIIRYRLERARETLAEAEVLAQAGQRRIPMAKFMVLHSVPPTTSATAAMPALQEKLAGALTSEIDPVRVFIAPGAGKIVCEMDAESEQALINFYARAQVPVDGIYPAQVVDRDELPRRTPK